MALLRSSGGPPPPAVTVPPSFICPISLQIMRDPVFASDGYTYEREELMKHLAKSHLSPMTREPLDSKLVPNRSLKSDIIAFVEAHPEHASDWYVTRALSDVGTLVKERKDGELKALLIDHPEVACGVVQPGVSIFHYICQHGTSTMLADFLELHQDVALKSKIPRPADWRPVVLNARFLEAVKRSDLASVRLCHQLGAELTAVNSDALPALSIASRDGLEPVVELLLELGAPVNARGPNGRTALHWAAASGRISIVKLLVSRKADLAAMEASTGWTPLHQASYAGATELCEVLLALGAPVNAPDDKQWTCLHWAAYAGHDTIVKLLLAHGAHVPASDQRQWTPLLWAAFAGREEAVRQLVQAGADLEAKTERGWTPLHAAAYNAHKGVIRVLLEAGAQHKAKNNTGKTPGELAAKNKWPEIDSYIKQVHAELKASLPSKLREQKQLVESLRAQLQERDRQLEEQRKAQAQLNARVCELETTLKSVLALKGQP